MPIGEGLTLRVAFGSLMYIFASKHVNVLACLGAETEISDYGPY